MGDSRPGLREVFLATRPWSFPLTIIAVGFGIAYGYWSTGYINVPLSIIAIAGSILLHALVNVTNDYFDYSRGVDKPGAGTTMYRPHPIVHGILSPKATLSLGLSLGSLGLATAFILALQDRILAPIMGALGFILAYGYTGPPFNLKYRALGELAVFVAWGPLMSIGGYYIATGSTAFLEPALASIPVGSLVTSVLLANNLRDIKYDKEAGIRTLAIILGRNWGLKLYAVLTIIVPSASLAVLAIVGVVPLISLISLVSIYPLAKLYNVMRKEIPIDADPRTAQATLLFGALYIMSIVLSSLIQ